MTSFSNRPSFQPDRQPVINLPLVILWLVVAFVAVHLWRTWILSPEDDFQTLMDYALIPARWSIGYLSDGARLVVEHVNALEGGERVWKSQLAQFLIQEAQPKPWTIMTYAFLHGSWMHLGFNVIWLAAFGSPIARRWGDARFLMLCVLTAGGGALAHYISRPLDLVPTIGASGIVSGMMGAAVWFAFSPSQRRWDKPELPHHERLRLSLAGLMRNRTVVGFILIWFVTNYVFAVMAEPMGFGDASIAWQAHIGGFLIGFLMFPLLDRKHLTPKI